jgi:LysM repeat protein
MRKRQIFVLSGFFALGLSFIFSSDSSALEYKVKNGDSLSTISRKFHISVQDIQQANGLAGSSLQLNQVLNIPEEKINKSVSAPKEGKKVVQSPDYYIVKQGDNLGKIAQKTGVPVKKLIAINKVQPKSLRIGQKLTLTTKPKLFETEIIDEENALLEEDEDIDIAAITEEEQLEKEKLRYAELLGKWNNPDERKLLVKVATGFLGAPYKLGGATVQGIDCSAYVRKMYQFFDITLPRTAREQSRVGMAVGKDELEEGDLVFFRTRRPVGHVGIYVGNNEFVHASSGERFVRIDSLDKPYFQRRFVRAVRIKGLEKSNALSHLSEKS